jgi:prophage regulatory protein
MRTIRIQEVCNKLSVSRTSLWRLSRQPGFPKPINLGGSRMVVFLEAEIDAWLEAQAISHRVELQSLFDGRSCKAARATQLANLPLRVGVTNGARSIGK